MYKKMLMLSKTIYCSIYLTYLSGFEKKRSGGSKGGARDARPPGGPNSFNFMQFFGNFDTTVCWPPWELAPPPGRNPGSATETGVNKRKQSYCMKPV